MKQFIGILLALAGTAAAMWGAYHMVAGQAAKRVEIVGDFTVTTMNVGLVGVLVLTLGLLRIRE